MADYPPGLTIFASERHPESRADISIFSAEKQQHLDLQKKQDKDVNVLDLLCQGTFATSQRILFDRGYVDVQRDVRAFVPKERLPRRPLTSTKTKTEFSR